MIDNTGNAEALLRDGPETVVVLENDIDTRLGGSLLDDVKNLVVIDAMDSPTASRSSIILPAASFAEAEGTFVNNEGRAQRSMATFTPAGDITPGYQLLSALGGDHLSASGWQQKLAAEHASLAGVVTCAPDEQFRIEGSRIARMTHRASGRTAMLANVSVHEPQQPLDTESPLAFTMEGNQTRAPASLRPYTWSPGWNSNQALFKFQQEVGGSLRGGDPGVRLAPCETGVQTSIAPADGGTVSAGLRLVHLPQLFGSEELSASAPAITARMQVPWIVLHPDDANGLGVAEGDGVDCAGHSLEVRVDADMAPGFAAVTVGMPEAPAWLPVGDVLLSRDPDFVRRPTIIAKG